MKTRQPIRSLSDQKGIHLILTIEAQQISVNALLQWKPFVLNGTPMYPNVPAERCRATTSTKVLLRCSALVKKFMHASASAPKPHHKHVAKAVGVDVRMNCTTLHNALVIRVTATQWCKKTLIGYTISPSSLLFAMPQGPIRPNALTKEHVWRQCTFVGYGIMRGNATTWLE